MTEGMERIAAAVIEAQKEVDLVEKALKKQKEELLELQMELAQQMDEKGITEFKVKNSDGSVTIIKIKDDVRGSMPAEPEKRRAAAEELRAKGYGNILKPILTVSLGGGVEPSHPLYGLLRSSGLPFEQKDDVHPATLSKLFRELMDEGLELDWDKFNFYQKRVATVKIKQ